jgi:hypothetical protein
MCDNLILGMAVGFIVGALLVRNNEKANEFIDDSKKKIVETIEKM